VVINTQRADERSNGTYSVGGTSDNVDHRNGVEKGLASNDVPGGPAVVHDIP